MANKLLGQNFLINSGVARTIVRALDISSDDLILEIGPGHGELTMLLAAECTEKKCEIIAVEKDPQLAEKLEIKLHELDPEANIQIIKGDILEFLDSMKPTAADIKDGRAKSVVHEKKLKIVGNIPYYLTGRLLRKISEEAIKPGLCILMTQEEVAERIVAAPPKMNRLAASVQFWGMPEIMMRVPKKSFRPMPKVDSAVIKITRNLRDEAAAREYYKAVKMLFAQPRKTILNNISAEVEIDKENIKNILATINIDPLKRPQDLSISDINLIADEFFGRGAQK